MVEMCCLFSIFKASSETSGKANYKLPRVIFSFIIEQMYQKLIHLIFLRDVVLFSVLGIPTDY